MADSDPVYVQLRGLGLIGESVKVEDLTLFRETAGYVLKQGEIHFVTPVASKTTGAVSVGGCIP
jgi:hypothetical protein